MFEPAVAVTSFYIWVHLWFFGELAAMKGHFPWLIRHKIKASPTLEETRPSAWYTGWWKHEILVYLLPLWALSFFFDAFAPRRLALEQAAPTIWRIGREIVGGLFFYDLFFWMTHVPLHKVSPWLYKHLHAKHHTSTEVRASDVVRLTSVEELTDVACSIAGLRILQAHPISRSLYNIVITGLLTELHCGYDLPMSLQNIIPWNIWGGSRRHHKHHRNGKAYFQMFVTYLDNLFGFVDQD
jgi:sterol desaturase/sphingolipid hydroxylase (fatty acid hydroxylase superfamily)